MSFIAHWSWGRFLSRIRSPTGLAITALAGIILTFYARLWLPELVLTKRDAFRYYLPLKGYAVERLMAGELPQWFPYEAMGRPFIGVPGTGVFHPFTALYFLFSTIDAYRAATLLSCVLAALGAFILARSLRISRSGALLSGLAFACSGYVVSLTEDIVYLYSMCMLPLFCAALERAFERGGGWIIAPAAIWASVFLNGDVQTGYYYGGIALLWVLMRRAQALRVITVRFFSVSFLSLLLAGVQLAPAAAVFVGSERTQPAAFHEQAVYWSTHPLRLLTLVASPIDDQENRVAVAHHIFGSKPPGESPVGYWAESLYLGLPVVVLALWGGWSQRNLLRFVLLGSLALVLSLGRFGGLYEVFYHMVPLWSAFRYPERLMGIVSFCLAILAGAGFDELRKGKGHPAVWVGLVGLCVIMWAGLRTETITAWIILAWGVSSELGRQVAEASARAFLYSAVAAAGVWLVVMARRRRFCGDRMLVMVLLGIIALDLTRVNLAAYHTGPAEIATFAPGLAEAIKRHAGMPGPGQFRILPLREPDVVFPVVVGQTLDRVNVASLMQRQALNVEQNAEFHLEAVKAYMPGFGKGLATLIDLANTQLGLQAYARYNVTYVIGRKGHFTDLRFAQVFVASLDAYDLAVVQNPYPVKPRAYLSARPERTQALVDWTAMLTRPDFLSGETDYLESQDIQLPGRAGNGHASVEMYEPENVRVRVETPQPAVLILSDTFDRGWQASLEDGTGLTIVRANAVVRAVTVPAGTHTVTFRYRTPLLIAGACSSLIGLLICAGIVFCFRWPRRKN